ncbi:sugar-binding protein [Paenarthrobacter sp. Z7-10]|uniref:substrate-binding domain-containing protein n=1 Tax=Paenarthrobacter sp. Z7-10 TaxID=2787635 RepID=UPI0022A8DF1C|nr:sugar-binding protein [Paenarthrobacter sp. Z7-10]MCZ2403119.1 sugar-binding protein [Paenarthrobacter sp. Z7-10]
MKFQKLIVGALAAGLVLGTAACGTRGAAAPAAGGDNSGALVGIAMPTKTSERWIKDGDAIKASLEQLGYKTDLEYGDDKIPQQVQQISNMITKGAKVLIVASIDGAALSDQLDSAAKAGIKVIAYDRLINGNRNVDYYTTFDNEKVGVQQATSLLTGLGVLDKDGKETGKKGPFNVELFAGSPDDNNATFFYNGAMKTLKKYLDDGALVVKSGQIISALTGSGYATNALPVITGQDAEAASVKSIIAGQQYSTIYKDTRELGKQAVTMADDLLKGKTPKVNDTTSYDNKAKIVPTFLLQPVVVTKDNYKKILIDGGYYKESDLK